MKGSRRLAAALIAVATALLIVPVAASAAPGYKVVFGHANNPRQLSFAPNGALYVGEAGKSGSICLDPEDCLGFTGSVTKIWGDSHSRVARRIVSLGGQDGSFTVGADGVSVDPWGRVYVQITSAGPPPLPPVLPNRAKQQLGNLMRVGHDGNLVKVADIDNYEFNHDPDGQGVDSDPYAVLALRHQQIVTDAAGNTVLRVRHGHVRLLAVLPNNSAGEQSVPTSLTRGPHGSVLVGELGGEGTPPGGSRVWQIWPDKLNQTPKLFASGFSAITGLDWHNGALYVAEFSIDFANQNPNGDVIKLKHGHRTTLGAGILHFPGGVAVDKWGRVYVSNWSILPGFPIPNSPFPTANGQVIRLK